MSDFFENCFLFGFEHFCQWWFALLSLISILFVKNLNYQILIMRGINDLILIFNNDIFAYTHFRGFRYDFIKIYWNRFWILLLRLKELLFLLNCNFERNSFSGCKNKFLHLSRVFRYFCSPRSLLLWGSFCSFFLNLILKNNHCLFHGTWLSWSSNNWIFLLLLRWILFDMYWTSYLILINFLDIEFDCFNLNMLYRLLSDSFGPFYQI